MYYCGVVSKSPVLCSAKKVQGITGSVHERCKCTIGEEEKRVGVIKRPVPYFSLQVGASQLSTLWHDYFS